MSGGNASGLPTIERLCAPLSVNEVADLILGAGFAPGQYMTIRADAGSTEDRTATIRHFMSHGINEYRSFPSPINLPGMQRLASAPLQNRLYRTVLVSALGRALLHDTRANLDKVIDGLLPAVCSLCKTGAMPVLLIGDSHSNLYRGLTARGNEWVLPLHLLCSGGSAMGLNNPASRSGYGPRIGALLRSIAELEGPADWPILFKFGQVDTEFVYTFGRIERHATAYDAADFASFCRRSTDNYGAFLHTIPSSLRQRTFVLSVFPPSLSDKSWAEGYANGGIVAQHTKVSRADIMAGVRSINIPDLHERTGGHQLYNDLLRKVAENAGVNYLDDHTALLTPFGIVNRAFLGHQGGSDHHLSANAMAAPTRATILHAVDLTRRHLAGSP